jgi:hypothetical protein
VEGREGGVGGVAWRGDVPGEGAGRGEIGDAAGGAGAPDGVGVDESAVGRVIGDLPCRGS